MTEVVHSGHGIAGQSVFFYNRGEEEKHMRQQTYSCYWICIGDGVNDVAMIQKAHVGIGIMGKQEKKVIKFFIYKPPLLQTKADYAIPRFMDLRRILFWHYRGMVKA